MHTIGKIAALAGVSPDTLRYYEKEQLIQPASKTAAGYRLYDDDALRRIRFIKHAQQCGFTLADILELLTLKQTGSACCGDVRTGRGAGTGPTDLLKVGAGGTAKRAPAAINRIPRIARAAANPPSATACRDHRVRARRCRQRHSRRRRR